MKFHSFVLRAANGLFSVVTGLLLLLSVSYSAFALWDNERIYAAAGEVQAEMVQLKPQLPQAEESPKPDFSALQGVNPDVCAWLTLDGTQIDYPILQGKTNYYYLNTDIYGNFALAGSIFLDTRNSRDFTDTYSLVYGHHMADGNMFGELERYKQEEFFRENATGILLTPGNAYELEVMACLLVGVSEQRVFDPIRWQECDREELLAFIQSRSVWQREETLARWAETEEPILALSTCSYEFTDARTVLLAVMRPCEGRMLDEKSTARYTGTPAAIGKDDG